MKVVYNRWIPVKGFKAVNLFGVCFAREGSLMTGSDVRHEEIHTAQMRELGYVFFYIIYFLEWLCRLVFHTNTAYRGISFEREAYGHQDDAEYLTERERYAQWRRG